MPAGVRIPMKSYVVVTQVRSTRKSSLNKGS